MELQVLAAFCHWLLLPLSLLAGCLFRYNVLSLVYLLYLLLLPWFLGPSEHSMKGHTGRLLKALLVTSLLFLLAHATFQVCLHTVPGLDLMLGYNCSTWDTLARHIGVSRLNFSNIPNTVRLLAPDLGIFLISAVTLGLCNRLIPKKNVLTQCQRGESREPLEEYEDQAQAELKQQSGTDCDEDDEEESVAAKQSARLTARLRVTANKLLKAMGQSLAILLLALAGITVPSAFSGAYYLLFIGICTWWACHFPISHLGFNALCVMVAFFAGGHLICLYSYQTPFIQQIFPPESILARVFGLKDIIQSTNCTSQDELVLNMSHDWPVYVNPGILLLLYLTMTSLLKLRKAVAHGQRDVADHNELSSLVSTQLAVELIPLERNRKAEESKPMLSTSVKSPGEACEDCTAPVTGDPAQEGLGQRKAEHHEERSPFHILSHVVMKQSYICALIAMMVWSITYHSWLTFVLLLWACLIWIVRSRRQFAMLCSPFILLYGLSLCSLQYVWGMDLEPELPTKIGFMSLAQLGLVRAQYPCLNLGAMLLYILTFWLLLRQFVQEKLLKKKQTSAVLMEVRVMETERGRRQNLLKVLGEVVMGFYAKYWIYVCAGMFIVVSFAGRLVVYKIVYMFLFLLCLTLFQVYYTLWRKLLKVFWWLVVAYTMLVLIAVYTFQFEDFPMYWRNFTHFTDTQLGDLGLEQFSVSELFSSILIPGFFLLACILQLHYCHRPFMQLTDLAHISAAEDQHLARDDRVTGGQIPSEAAASPEENGDADSGEAPSNKWGLVVERLMVLFWKFSDTLHRLQAFLWRLLELHILKAVALYIVWVALQEVSAMNFLFVIFWALAMPFFRFRHMASCLSTIWVSVIIVCKMLYQLNIVSPQEYSSNCTQPSANSTNLLEEEILNSTLYRSPVDPANWFGIRKGFPNLRYIQNHLQVLMILVFEGIIYRHQEYYRTRYQLLPPSTQTVFQDVSRKELDQGMLCCIKYFINYFFYKFGLEICFLLTVNVIGQRMNFMVIFHGCWLIVILTRRKRRLIASLWPKYCLFLFVFLLFQYLLCLGIPPVLCIEYPWRWSHFIPINSALIKWMYLPDFYVPPNSTNLIADFLLLLCAAQQWKVFTDEKKEEWYTTAGENTDDLEQLTNQPNPVPNFVNCRSYLDMLKVAVFRYLFWFVLVVVFVTGATRISIFGLGYLLACFYLLLAGTSMLQKPVPVRLALWDCLILYNVTVIISKNMLALLSCVFVQSMQSNFCWVIQLFSLVCTVKGYYNPRDLDKDKDCLLPVEEAGIIWDSICFFFLLMQRRVFLSYYSLHVTADLRATALQASRGFELVRASILKHMSSYQETQKKSLAQLKRQMERIRAKQQKYHQGRPSAGKDSEQDGEEQSGKEETSQQKTIWWRPWLNHASVLHSGEYYLFESDSEEEEESTLEEQKPAPQSAFQMAYQAWVTNAKSVLKARRQHQRDLQRAGQDSKEQKTTEGAEDPEAALVDPSGGTEIQEDEEVTGRMNVVHRILNVLKFFWILFLTMVDGLTQWLRTLTKHHVNMSTVLRVERYVLTQKLSKGDEVSRRTLDDLYQASQDIETPSTETGSQAAVLDESGMDRGPVDSQNSMASSGCDGEDVLSSPVDYTDATTPVTTGYNTRTNSDDQLVDTESLQGSQEILGQSMSRTRTASELLLNRHFCFEELEESEQFYKSQNRFLKLVLALYSFIAAHSELLCYVIIIVNNMVTASVISLFLPILVFLWAMLSIPRPSKRFWMTAIVFTEVMVVIKYLFQFGFFPWNSYTVLVRNDGKPYFPPRILGLEKTDSYIKYDLIQLMALFFHRSLLVCYGLWDHQEDKTLVKKKAKLAPDERESVREMEALPEDPAPAGGQGEPDTRKSRGGLLRFRKKRKRSSLEMAESSRGMEAKEEEEEEREPEEKSSGKARRRLKNVGVKCQGCCVNMAHCVYRPVKGFFHNILNSKYRAATDVYVLMFLADVIDFIIIIFGYWAFGKHSAAADIASSLSDDQVPEAFLVMLLIQFSTMVVDRALYLRKTVLGKLIFQVILVFGIHLWMFFILPAVTERMFNQNTVAQLWYFIKCIYFALSAYQIRCGYPTRILGNFLTKQYNHVNLFLFQGFRLVPFLVELRAVMDWVWTDTTLSLSNWMCVEDIYANIFIIKCSRETEKKYPQPKGQKKKKIVKYGMGGLIIFFLICIIWFPLLFMSLVRSVVGVVNHPIDVTVTLKLGGYEPLSTTSAQQQSIQPFTAQDYEALNNQFERQPTAMQFITLYSYEDIVTARIEGSSGSLWSISPPSREQMRKELQNSPSDVILHFTWSFQRDLAKGGTVEYASEKHTTYLEPGSPVRAELAGLLQGTLNKPVSVSHLFPKYIRAPNGPEANPVKQLQPGEEESYLDLELQLKRERIGEGNSSSSFLEWWVVQLKDCQDDCTILPMVIFSDKVSPPSLGFLAGYGIMGLYVSIVLVIGKFVRGFFSEVSHSIMFEELPCVDRILKLCQDIFLVRETGELELEEELYAKLIFLYRSPETMIKWTREKE
ncbi:piezo-type mechanosensitive ion channel component 1 isoform X2 [Rhinatrema bivittatum]|uniref:piezo-type mechanosensitive ion channel component 1 isoform X2 n=1 Tax=Rhinatrema bivittatum TaxID=194408 RepID=UPI00112C7495|nr:piezo-type mechanosensitive ion channel component 1 isoform X2 [Rhinatrema bivittatum]